MGNESVLGSAQVPIRAALEDLARDLDGAKKKIEDSLGKVSDDVGKKLSGLGDKLRDAAEKAMPKWEALGGTVAKIGGAAILGGVAAVAGGVTALGAAAYAAGSEFDEAFDNIAVQTGATGDQLDGLQQDFKEVFTSIPTQAGPASDVIAGLNRTLGVTGGTLTDLARPLLRVTDLVGGDATTRTQLLARTMGDWGIKVEDGSKVLDKMFVASQNSGVGLDALMQKVVGFGSPLRLMGFSLDESIALFAKWEKEGVNAELVMGSLRIAAGKFAKSGEPLRESLLATFDAIKGNKNESEALALAMETFGARAGPDMAAAIREGRFSIDDLTAALAGADGAIMKAAESTDDWPQKLEVLKNQATAALAPIGLKMMELAGILIDKAGPALDSLSMFMQDKVVPAIDAMANSLGLLLSGDLAGGLTAIFGPETAAQILGVIETMQRVAAFVQENLIPILAGVGAMILAAVIPAFVAWAGAAIPAAIATIAACAPLILIIGAIGAAVGLLVAAWMNDWGGIRTTLTEFWTNTAQPILQMVWDWLSVNIPQALTTVATFFTTRWTTISTFLTGLWASISSTATTAWNAISNFFTSIWTAITTGVQIAWTVITSLLRFFWELITGLTRPIWEPVVTVLAWVWDKVQRGAEIVWNAISGFLSRTWETISTAVGTAAETLQEALAVVWAKVREVLETAWNAISLFLYTKWETIKDQVKRAAEILRDSLETVWKSVKKTATDLWDDIEQFVVGVAKGLWNKISGPLDTLRGKWDEFWNGVKNFVSNILSGIHIPTPHISISYQDVPILGRIPSGASVAWYGMGGQFVARQPTLIGVGEAGPELVTVQRRDGRGWQPDGGGQDLTQLVGALQSQVQALADLIDTLGGSTTADQMMRERNLMARLNPLGS